jgi:SAM-dependent methyltransferase
MGIGPASLISSIKRRGVRMTLYRLQSMIGERTGWDSWTYNDGIFKHFHDCAVKNAPAVADAVLAEFPSAKRLDDVGCGSGAMAAEFKRRGLEVLGCEMSPRGRAYAGKQGVKAIEFFLKPDGNTPPESSPFDISFSTEVAEHVPAHLADEFVKFMIASGNDSIFTAAHPGQGGTGHINEQPQSYWIEKFERLGRRHDAAASKRIADALKARGTDAWLYQNMMVFRRA